jgi:tRNA-splicing ligase RtcB
MEFQRLDDYRWRIPRSGAMLTDGVVYADARLLEQIGRDSAVQQVANVACLPGIVGSALAMPDIHQGYGFPIGGVAAMAMDGVVSPGGVGSDINCGVRLLATDLECGGAEPDIEKLVDALFAAVPSGIGSTGPIRLAPHDEEQVLVRGAAWAVEHGYGWAEDLERTEAGGALPGADPAKLTRRSFERGRQQLGTLGAGNHFLEIQKVAEVYDLEAAERFGIHQGQLVVMIHSGSRGLGFQTCDDYVEVMLRAMAGYGIQVPDRQLACCPIGSPEGRDYLAAMACAANYAWANRQCIMHWVREAFERVLGNSAERLGMRLVYDVAHNIAKVEEHQVDGRATSLCVHRKGATRAFGPGGPDLPECYKNIGQPVIIPGDMGRASYLLVGTKTAMDQAWGSTCHGAGRLMSRTQALKNTRGRSIARELGELGIVVRSHGADTLREEAPEAYKDVDHVVDIVHNAGLSRRVAKMRPLGVVKG